MFGHGRIGERKIPEQPARAFSIGQQSFKNSRSCTGTPIGTSILNPTQHIHVIKVKRPKRLKQLDDVISSQDASCLDRLPANEALESHGQVCSGRS